MCSGDASHISTDSLGLPKALANTVAEEVPEYAKNRSDMKWKQQLLDQAIAESQKSLPGEKNALHAAVRAVQKQKEPKGLSGTSQKLGKIKATLATKKSYIQKFDTSVKRWVCVVNVTDSPGFKHQTMCKKLFDYACENNVTKEELVELRNNWIAALGKNIDNPRKRPHPEANADMGDAEIGNTQMGESADLSDAEMAESVEMQLANLANFEDPDSDHDSLSAETLEFNVPA